MLGKKSSQKSAKNFFLIHKNIVTKKLGGGKTCEAICPETQQKGRTKNVGKKKSQKIPKNRFLYSQEYRDQKWGGKKRAKHFFQKH